MRRGEKFSCAISSFLSRVRVESCVLYPALPYLCSLVPMSSESESTSCEPSGPKSPPIKPGRPRASPVWEHFVYDASKDKSICQVCVVEGDADSAATSGGRLCGVVVSGKYPTNLKAHLKAVHALTYDAVVQKEAANKKEKEQVC